MQRNPELQAVSTSVASMETKQYPTIRSTTASRKGHGTQCRVVWRVVAEVNRSQCLTALPGLMSSSWAITTSCIGSVGTQTAGLTGRLWVLLTPTLSSSFTEPLRLSRRDLNVLIFSLSTRITSCTTWLMSTAYGTRHGTISAALKPTVLQSLWLGPRIDSTCSLQRVTARSCTWAGMVRIGLHGTHLASSK